MVDEPKAAATPSKASAAPSTKTTPAAAQTGASPKPHGAPTSVAAKPQLIPSHGLPKDTRLTPEQVAVIPRAELVAIAADRGYQISNAAGRRATREAFLAAQAKDQNLKTAPASGTSPKA